LRWPWKTRSKHHRCILWLLLYIFRCNEYSYEHVCCYCVIYFPASGAGVSNMSVHYNLSPLWRYIAQRGIRHLAQRQPRRLPTCRIIDPRNKLRLTWAGHHTRSHVSKIVGAHPSSLSSFLPHSFPFRGDSSLGELRARPPYGFGAFWGEK